MDEMVAGAGNAGAEDAWYQLAVDFDEFTLEENAFCCSTADIAKCFDNVPRALVYRLAALAGMPEEVLTAYKAFQENLTIHNSVAGCIGQAFMRRVAIPQGFPNVHDADGPADETLARSHEDNQGHPPSDSRRRCLPGGDLQRNVEEVRSGAQSHTLIPSDDGSQDRTG